MRDGEIQLVLNHRRWRWAGQPWTPIYLCLSLVCVRSMDLWLGLSPSPRAGEGWEFLLPGEKLPARGVKNRCYCWREPLSSFVEFLLASWVQQCPLDVFTVGSGVAFWVYLGHCTSPCAFLSHSFQSCSAVLGSSFVSLCQHYCSLFIKHQQGEGFKGQGCFTTLLSPSLLPFWEEFYLILGGLLS